MKRLHCKTIEFVVVNRVESNLKMFVCVCFLENLNHCRLVHCTCHRVERSKVALVVDVVVVVVLRDFGRKLKFCRCWLCQMKEEEKDELH